MRTKSEKIKSDENASLIADELDRVSAISAIGETEGGKILLKGLVTEVFDTLDILCANYTKLTQQEFIGHCASIKTKLDMVRTIKRAKKAEKQAREDLENALNEIPE